MATAPKPLNSVNVGLLRGVRDLLVRDLELVGDPPIGDAFRAYPRVLHVFQHGRLMSWIPVAAAMAVHCVEEGAGDRVPFRVSHDVFGWLPGAQQLLDRFLPNSAPLTFDSIVKGMQAGHFSDLLVSPEGDNCNFGDGRGVAQFRSPRFVEIALRCEVPMLLITHIGTEHWGIQVPIPEQYRHLTRYLGYGLQKRVEEHGHIVLPLIRRCPRVAVKWELYWPELELAELSDDATERRAQLWVEAERVRARMQAMVGELRQLESGSPDCALEE